MTSSNNRVARRFLGNALCRATHPALLMILVWGALSCAFVFGPLEYYREPDAITWLIVAFCVMLFCAGIVTTRQRNVRTTWDYDIDKHRLSNIIIAASLIGIFGAILMVVDKLFLSGLDYSEGLAAIRYQRVEEVDAGIDVPRSPLLYLGYLIFSFSYPAIALLVLEAETISKRAALCAQLSVISPLAYALIHGGRGPFLLLCYLVLGALLIRASGSNPIIPRAHGIRWKLLLCAVAFLSYVNFTWEDRRSASNIEDYSTFLASAEDNWSLAPKPWVQESIDAGIISENFAMNAMSLWLYPTHGIITLDKIRERYGDFFPYYGLFQIDVLSPIVYKLFPRSDIVERMRIELENSDIYGWFATAWGAWFLDFGLAGAAFGIFLWGWLCGTAYQMSRSRPSTGIRLLFSFGLASILLSPINAPVGMSNSAMIFITYLILAYVIQKLCSRRILKFSHEARQIGV